MVYNGEDQSFEVTQVKKNRKGQTADAREGSLAQEAAECVPKERREDGAMKTGEEPMSAQSGSSHKDDGGAAKMQGKEQENKGEISAKGVSCQSDENVSKGDTKEKKRAFRAKCKLILILGLSFLKIGLFTFGGGYAMIALIQKEFVSKRKWIGETEFMDVVAIAESTPGPLAINSATYIGYKVGKTAGAAISTLCVCIPSFVIIYLISLFFDAFLQFTLVQYAFKGIQVCVVFLIFTAGWKMLRQMQKDLFNLVLFLGTILCLVAFSVTAVDFSSIFYILICGAAGLGVYLVSLARKKGKGNNAILSKKQEDVVQKNGQNAVVLQGGEAEKQENAGEKDGENVCKHSVPSDGESAPKKGETAANAGMEEKKQ